jgi:hypothetical protein
LFFGLRDAHWLRSRLDRLRLTRQGYNAQVLAELLNAKSREINSFLSGQLAPGRTPRITW